MCVRNGTDIGHTLRCADAAKHTRICAMHYGDHIILLRRLFVQLYMPLCELYEFVCTKSIIKIGFQISEKYKMHWHTPVELCANEHFCNIFFMLLLLLLSAGRGMCSCKNMRRQKQNAVTNTSNNKSSTIFTYLYAWQQWMNILDTCSVHSRHCQIIWIKAKRNKYHLNAYGRNMFSISNIMLI